MKNSLLTKTAIIICLLLLAVVALGAGTAYWIIHRFKDTTDSFLNASHSALIPPAESLPTSGIDVPEKSVEGQDLNEAPPYANAVRSNYFVSNDKIFFSVEYIAPANSAQIMDFYKKYFDEKKWILVTSDQRTATFTEENSSLTLQIVAENKTDPPATQYSLNLTKSRN